MVANEHFKRRSRHRISAQNILAGVSGGFFLLCDACPALESAGKHLEAYLQECRTDDRGDTIRALRLQALYRLSSHLAHPESNVLVCTKAEAAQALACVLKHIDWQLPDTGKERARFGMSMKQGWSCSPAPLFTRNYRTKQTCAPHRQHI